MKTFTVWGSLSHIHGGLKAPIVSGEVIFTPRNDSLYTVDGSLSTLNPVMVTLVDGAIPPTVLLASPDSGHAFVQWGAAFRNLVDENGSTVEIDPIAIVGQPGEVLAICDARPICEDSKKLLLAGPKGDRGDRGDRGPAGGGSAWFDGDGPPEIVIGASAGDFYIDRLTWIVYKLE